MRQLKKCFFLATNRGREENRKKVPGDPPSGIGKNKKKVPGKKIEQDVNASGGEPLGELG